MTNDTIKIQARSADEVRATKRIVLYKDGCEREFYLFKADGCVECQYESREPNEFPCNVCNRNHIDMYRRRADEHNT